MRMKRLLLCSLFLAACGCGTEPPSKRIVVLGIDGMDPGFLERHWESLPNLRELSRRGGFQRLATTAPPQSPVAWSTFITGMDPDGHGIFDFVHRDPSTLMPFSSIAETTEPRHKLSLGPYSFPISRGEVRSLRKGTPFWQILAEHEIPVTIIRMPTNFPPHECEGRTLAGMGVPDLKGTVGAFTYFTSDPQEIEREVPGGRIVPVQLEHNSIDLRIEGPANSLRRDGRQTEVYLRVTVDPEARAARFEAAGKTFILKEREWSDWVPVRFPMLGPFLSASGMFRVFAKQIGDDVGLYVSPVNLDPTQPELPLSTPPSYSRDLARAVGLYYTQGIAEDTSALRHGVFTLPEYLMQSRLVAMEHLRLFREAFRSFRAGVLFFHFFGIDQNSHVLWGRHDNELLETYKLVDREVGWVMRNMGEATLIVMSDHGFTSFDRSVHLNTWLWEEGFLSLKDLGDAGAIDWTRTKAYALGLNGLYLNVRGREREGVLTPGKETEAVIRTLKERLLEFRDPKDGKPVVDTLRETRGDGPDLIVGYYPGFRASWQTALGGTQPEVMEDNLDAWIGDHCVEARHVPGVLLTNRKTKLTDPKLADVTVTLLEEFGIAKSPGMKGHHLY